MYQYDGDDNQFLTERLDQFALQVERFLNHDLDEDKFRALRLRNGLYKQLHAYMLRVAIPYGVLSADQLRQLAAVADEYDRGIGHFTTRQNMQFNWIDVKDIVAILRRLAEVGVHATQTSGSVVRNITTDYMAGIGRDEVADPRPYCEILRQWFTNHHEFSWMAGKFKIAVGSADNSRVAVKFHDLGLQLKQNEQGELGFGVYVGGGLGSFPVVGEEINSFLAVEDLISYVESILRVYNLENRRDHDKKRRIKFLVKTLGIDEFRKRVEADWRSVGQQAFLQLSNTNIERIKANFVLPIVAIDSQPSAASAVDTDYQKWAKHYVLAHKIDGYQAVMVPLAFSQRTPGDVTSAEMRLLAQLADQYSLSELRTTIEQKVVFPYVKKSETYALWQALKAADLVDLNQYSTAHIVCCPGGDYCSLAKTKSIPIAKQLRHRLDAISQSLNVGDLSINISGCENSCAQHHIADIGLLGLLKGGEPYYQITLAGDESLHNAQIGRKLGASVSAEQIETTIEKIIKLYVKHKKSDERFVQVFARIGIEPFKREVYDSH